MPYVPDDDRTLLDSHIKLLACAIAEASKKHNYESAFAGELNYSLTRLLQELPRELVKVGLIKEELRYWLQPMFFGILLDVALEYKRRVNVAYEAEQIVKNGDCYDAPYYTKLMQVIDDRGNFIGYQEVMVKRSPETLEKDILDAFLVASHYN